MVGRRSCKTKCSRLEFVRYCTSNLADTCRTRRGISAKCNESIRSGSHFSISVSYPIITHIIHYPIYFAPHTAHSLSSGETYPWWHLVGENELLNSFTGVSSVGIIKWGNDDEFGLVKAVNYFYIYIHIYIYIYITKYIFIKTFKS